MAANLVLNTSILSSVINRRPEKLWVEWESGRSLLPGIVSIRGLRVRGQSKSMQWQCTIDAGRFRIALLPLFTKAVRIHRGEGSSFAFYARQRFAASGADAEVARHLPEIEGLENPPIAAPEVLYPPRAKPPKRPWVIDVDDVAMSGPIDLWLGRLEVLGDGEIGGSVDVEVGGALGVPRVSRF